MGADHALPLHQASQPPPAHGVRGGAGKTTGNAAEDGQQQGLQGLF